MYKTIVVHVDGSSDAASRLAIAGRLAIEHEAHLVGSAVTGISRQAFAMLLMSPGVMMGNGDFDVLRQNAAAQLQGFAAHAERVGIASWEQRIVEDDAEHALVLESLYADLIVLGPAPAGQAHRLTGDLVDHVALHATCPVLVVPEACTADALGRTIVLGWDGGREASRALHAALPLLRRAALVVVALVDPDPALPQHGPRPGADIATYLARHGVTVEVVSEHGVHGAAEALLRVARDRGADLVVAGAYGHSRARELFFGGATRALLDHAAVPLLLAH